jgi:sigma-B regulation protein RsbQ
MTQTLSTRNNINIFGKGEKIMLFLHGYGCDQNMWRFITPAFENDYKIVLIDHVGSGKSEIEAYDFEKYSSLRGYANDVIEICEYLGEKDITVIAHSVSGMIAMLAAAERPEFFSKLVLVGPSPCYINKGDYYGGFTQEDIDELINTLEGNYLGWSSFITPVIIGDDNKKEYSTELKNSFCAMNPEIAKHFAKVTFLSDNRTDLERVVTESLVIQTNPDVIAPVKVGKYVSEKLPKATYVELDAVGHCPHLTAPEKVIKATKVFLS